MDKCSRIAFNSKLKALDLRFSIQPLRKQAEFRRIFNFSRCCCVQKPCGRIYQMLSANIINLSSPFPLLAIYPHRLENQFICVRRHSSTMNTIILKIHGANVVGKDCPNSTYQCGSQCVLCVT